MGLSGFLGTSRFVDPTLNATAQVVPPSGVAALTLFGIYVDNSQNVDDTFVKIYDKATAPGVGTDNPEITIRVKAGDTLFTAFGDKFEGIAIATGLWIAGVTTGGTGGTTAPTNPVKAMLITD